MIFPVLAVERWPHTRLEASADAFSIETQNDEDGTGHSWEWDDGAVTVDTQPQWYDQGPGSPSDTVVQGYVDVPDDLTDPRCLEWNGPTCKQQETTQQVHQRVAENHLEPSFSFVDGGQAERVPARQWAGAIR